MPATVKVLVQGFTNADSLDESAQERTRATITLVRDGDLVMVVDPGVLENQQILVDALNEEGLSIEDVGVVCITHSHIDHYRNIGIFPEAKILEFYGLWDKDAVQDWQEWFSPNIQILKTPGHDSTSITLFVTTDKGVVAICGDVFWKENYPKEPRDDAYASDTKKLQESREKVLEMADWIIPGHAGLYKVEKVEKNEIKNMTLGSSKNKDAKVLAVCRKCHKPIKEQQDRCLCQPSLCYHCCECDLDCDLCNCKHKR
jgi:glyoxylase-like metal-dependent hydrolase (beta-lactamase superfamily II)